LLVAGIPACTVNAEMPATLARKKADASLVDGSSTQHLVDMLKEGLTGYILDGQTFDLDAVSSIASDPRHVPAKSLYVQLPRQGKLRVN
jgi:citrate lyase subunit alpha/citrate CoA-transferase